jgi:hypothetical protein
MPCPARLSSDALTLGSSWSGLVVGTKLGTVGTVAAGPHNSSHMSELPTSPQRDPESCDELRNMLCPRQGVKNGGGWGVVRYDNRSTNFCRLLGSCSRFEQNFQPKGCGSCSVSATRGSITADGVSPYSVGYYRWSAVGVKQLVGLCMATAKCSLPPFDYQGDNKWTSVGSSNRGF